MEHHVCELLELALMTLHAEFGRYDWVPSTALAGTSVDATGSTGGGQGGFAWLHPQALDLTRHRPLAVFTNDLVQMFNELRQCALCGLRVPVVSRTYDCLIGAINLLKSVRGLQAFQPGSPKAAELNRCCKHFAHILIPLVAAHLEAVYGPTARLDTGTIIATMVPDLLTVAETADPALLAISDDGPAAEELPTAGEADEAGHDLAEHRQADGDGEKSGVGSGGVDVDGEESKVSGELPQGHQALASAPEAELVTPERGDRLGLGDEAPLPSPSPK